jgi:hypothetical protein
VQRQTGQPTWARNAASKRTPGEAMRKSYSALYLVCVASPRPSSRIGGAE